jgi:FkbM family methyltransferase
MVDNSEAVKAFYVAEAKDDVRLKYPLTQDSIVIDLGAFKGEWALQIAKRYGCTVFACEPVASIFQECQKAVAGTKVQACNFAVGGSTREDHITVDADGSSLNMHPSNGMDLEKISILAIDEFMQQYQIDRVDLIKLNVEGSEFEIMERLIELGWLDRFTDFQIQFHPTVPNYEKRRVAIQNKLYETHWQTYNFEWVWENWRRR